MKSKKNLLFFLLSSFLFGVGYFIAHVYDCGYSLFCYNLIFHIGSPLMYGMLGLAVVFGVLLFVPKAYGAWKKFAVWAIPFMVIVFFLAPSERSGLGVLSFGPSQEQIFQWVSALYVLISLGIIGRVKLKGI